jgi:hypothetical protein
MNFLEAFVSQFFLYSFINIAIFGALVKAAGSSTDTGSGEGIMAWMKEHKMWVGGVGLVILVLLIIGVVWYLKCKKNENE